MAGKKVLKHGILVAIEGIDGAGKSTQSRLLFEKLKNTGYSVVLLHEPTNGQWGEKIRDLAKNGRHKKTAQEELELFYQDRLEDVEKNIRPKMLEKNVVIMDRYYFSSVAYQGVRGLDPDYVERRNEAIAPKPDILIILDISPPDSLKRIRATRGQKDQTISRKPSTWKRCGVYFCNNLVVVTMSQSLMVMVVIPNKKLPVVYGL